VIDISYTKNGQVELQVEIDGDRVTKGELPSRYLARYEAFRYVDPEFAGIPVDRTLERYMRNLIDGYGNQVSLLTGTGWVPTSGLIDLSTDSEDERGDALKGKTGLVKKKVKVKGKGGKEYESTRWVKPAVTGAAVIGAGLVGAGAIAYLNRKKQETGGNRPNGVGFPGTAAAAGGAAAIGLGVAAINKTVATSPSNPSMGFPASEKAPGKIAGSIDLKLLPPGKVGGFPASETLPDPWENEVQTGGVGRAKSSESSTPNQQPKLLLPATEMGIEGSNIVATKEFGRLVPAGDTALFLSASDFEYMRKSGADKATNEILQAASIINSVHGLSDPSLKSSLPLHPQVILISEKFRQSKGYGEMTYEPVSFTPEHNARIFVTTGVAKGDYTLEQAGITFTHEIGHMIDHKIFSSFGRYGSRAIYETYIDDNSRHQDQTPVMQAIVRSEGVQKLRGMREVERKENPLKKTYLQYLIKYEELWARAYAQWIASEDESGELKKQLNQLRDSPLHDKYPYQWSDSDFEPIRMAFNELAVKRGWRKQYD